MKITCHSCSAKYTVSDEKVQGKTVKMKCRKCGATIVVGGAGGAAAEASAAPVDDAAQGEAPLPVGSYLVNVADNDQRTMSTPEILDAIRQGVINGDTYVWTDGMADWQAIADHAELAQGLGGGAPAAPAAVPSPGYGSSPYGGASSFDGNGNGNAHAPLAAAGTDSSRPAARKDTARRGNDLFGGGGGGASLSSGGGLSGGFAAAAPTAGKRDENSVLFSLSALTQASPASTRNATTATKDDSGLIDLKALAATATPAPTAHAAPMLESPALFPLGAAPAPVAAVAAPTMAGLDVQPKKNAMLIPLALAGVLAVGLIIAVFFLVQGSGPAPQPSVVYVEKPAAAPTETVAAAPTTAPTTDATADAAASASSTAVAAAPKGGWKGGSRPGTPATAKTTTGGSTPTPPATSKPSTAKKCGCAPGDLACAMKCSAK